MESELAGVVDGIAERFVPEEMHGQLIEAEHLSRYWWAASLASGRRVLDAGCGTAYGTAILAGAGAREVVGVDAAADVLAAVKTRMPRNVRLQQADVASLPFDAGSFDLIVCFEVIEHVEDADAVFHEFARVLAEDGVLAVSSPNRDVYMPGNPHHTHEFLPDELAEALARRFENVRLFRQSDWITAAVLDDELHTAEGGDPLRSVELRKAVAGTLGRELYTLALASQAELPTPPASAVVTNAAELRDVVESRSRLDEEHEKLAVHYRAVEKERRGLKRATARAQQDALDAQKELGSLGARLLGLEADLARSRQRIASLTRRAGDFEALEERLREVEEAARRTHEDLKNELKNLGNELKEARGVIREMEETRVWRVGTGLWRLRDRLLFRRRGAHSA